MIDDNLLRIRDYALHSGKLTIVSKKKSQHVPMDRFDSFYEIRLIELKLASSQGLKFQNYFCCFNIEVPAPNTFPSPYGEPIPSHFSHFFNSMYAGFLEI